MTERSPIHAPLSSTVGQPGQALASLRAAQAKWQALDYRQRLKIIGKVAGRIATSGEQLAHMVSRPAATIGEIMASELLPLAEACRYTARRGGQILGPRKLPARDAAWWMGSVRVSELREALGVVLIIGPSNYPLFLPGVQMIQALAAGNAVIVKPAPGCEMAMQGLLALCVEAGVPAELMLILDSAPEASAPFIESGVDKVIFTGSFTTGRKVAALCAANMTPVAMELSGNDAVLVCDDADLERVTECIAYALTLNGGQTCIAPRRLLATSTTLQKIIPRLSEKLQQSPARIISERGLAFARGLIDQAIADGASIACGERGHMDQANRVKPIVLAGVDSDMAIAQEDLFAPVLSLIQVEDIQEAVRQSAQCRYALGAAIFGRSQVVEELASQVMAGCVTINDVLVPTADARVSFGGRRASGYGLTRGLEGLRELTQLKVLCIRRGRWLPHLTTSAAQLAPMMLGILNLRYGSSWKQRWAGVKGLMKAGKQK